MTTLVDTAPATQEMPDLESLLASCPLSDEARDHLEPEQTANAFLGRLIEQQLYIDALRLTAYKLPRRTAIWWAAMCLWHHDRTKPAAATDAAFAAVVRWVQEPKETHRRAAEVAAREAGVNSPVGMLAMAVFFSGGSISLPDCPEVNPEPHATAQQVAAAVVLAAKTPPSNTPAPIDSQRRFLVLAAAVENEQLPWDRPPSDDPAERSPHDG